MNDVIYAPAVIKMAESKRQYLVGAALANLDALIANARQADAAAMALPLYGDAAARETAFDRSDAATIALRDFALEI